MEKKQLPNTSMQPLFEGLNPCQVNSIVKLFNGFVRHYSKADYVYLAGDCVENMYVLLSGSLQMIREDFWGEKTIIEGLGPGYVFTEAYLSKDKAESDVSYFVASDSEVLVLPLANETLKEQLDIAPLGKMLYNLIGIMARQNKDLVEKNELICKKTLRDKILTYLSQQAKLSHCTTFTIPFNRTDFASFLDSDRSALTRELTKMKEEGIIDFTKNTFTIKETKRF